MDQDLDSNQSPRLWLTPWVALVLWCIAGALFWLQHAQQGWVNTDQPHASLPREQAPAPTPPAAVPPDGPGRAVVVLVSGLRYDVAQELPTLQALGRRGVFGQAEAPLPTFTRPAYTSMVTGASPDRTGVRTDRFLKPVPVDSVLARLKQERRRVVGGGNLDHMSQNLQGLVDRWHLEYQWRDAARTDQALAQALREDAALVLLHLRDLDDLARDQGCGPAYREAALALDARLGQLLEAVDLERDVVMVLSDHGHLARGGHGGPEKQVRHVPWVMAGRGVLQSAQAPGPLGSLARVAPTLSVLLGVPYPVDMDAAPLLELLDPQVVSQPYLDARRREWIQHRSGYERLWLTHIYQAWTSTRWSGEVVGNHVSQAAHIPEGASLEVLLAARRETLAEIRRDRRVGRTPLFALLLVPLGVMFGVGLLRGHGLRPALAVPAFGLGAWLVLWLLQLPLSFSAVGSEARFGLHLLGVALGGLALYLVALAPLARARPAGRRWTAARFHATAMALVYASAAPLVWLITGFAIKAPIPSPWLMFLPKTASLLGAGLLTLAGLLWVAEALREARSRRQASPRPPA